MLAGEIPATFTNLINLRNGDGLDLRWNGLSTDDIGLRDFLDTKQEGGNWTGTQTVTPSGLAAAPAAHRILVTWEPIEYAADPGGYEVYASAAAAGTYISVGTTPDKAATSLGVEGLATETAYYFKVRTITWVHDDNFNTLVSDFSGVVSATTRSEDIFADGFDSGDCSAWSGEYP
jgi:hypothetical protein